MVGLKCFKWLLLAVVVAGDQVPHASGKYIITLKNDISARDVDSHMDWVDGVHTSTIGRRDFNHKGVTKNLDIGDSFRAYAAEFHPDAVQMLRDHPAVRSIEPDLPLRPRTIYRQSRSTWALSSVSHRCPVHLWSTPEYLYDDNAGKGAYVYIIDYAINVKHSEFGGRAELGFSDASAEGLSTNHGTWVAGLVASKTYGVAKKAKIIAVNLGPGNDDAFVSTFISGIRFIIQDARKHKRLGRAVISTSLGTNGFKSDAMKQATELTFQHGLLVVSAAGNENEDTALTSPGSDPFAFSVGSVNQRWEKFEHSNFGNNVLCHAPGVNVESLAAGPEHQRYISNGTSASAPIVAGVAALLLGQRPYSDPGELGKAIMELASKDKIRGLPSGNRNNLVYTGVSKDNRPCRSW